MITSKRFCNIKTLSISTTLSYDQPHMQRYVKSDTSLSLSLAGVRVSAAGTDLINVHVHWSCRRSLEESLATQRKSWSKRQTKTRNKACLRHLDIHDLVSALSLSLSLSAQKVDNALVRDTSHLPDFSGRVSAACAAVASAVGVGAAQLLRSRIP